MLRAALREQVDGLFGWKAQNVLDWLVSNPNGPSKDEQRESLLTLLETADEPESAASHVLQTIWSRLGPPLRLALLAHHCPCWKRCP